MAGAVLIGLVGGKVSGLPERVATSGDTFALTAAPDESTGDENYLAAGGQNGGAAITFVKFNVKLPEDRLPRRAWLWLGVKKSPLPDLVELSQVPDTRWTESTLTATNAPRLGKVVASVFPKPNAPAIAFDVTKALRGSGTVAFAVTAPTSAQLAQFVASESLSTFAGPPTITFEWSTGPIFRDPPVTPPAFATSPLIPELPPLVSPWPDAPPAVFATASTSNPPPALTVPNLTPPTLPTFEYVPPPPPTIDLVPPTLPTNEPVLPEPPALPVIPALPAPPVVPEPSAPPLVDPSPPGAPVVEPSPPVVEPSLPVVEPSLPVVEPSPSVPAPPVVVEPTQPTQPVECVAGERLVPSCGALWGVAPGAHTSQDRTQALADFEERAGKPQMIYHAYHRGRELFPTAAEVAIARDAANPRILFLNWKPTGATWGQIAAGDPATDAYLDQLAAHIKANLSEQFFFTMHHEPENDVVDRAGSGMTAKDYSSAFRHVIQRLRANGVANLVSTMCYMAYIPWNVQPWFGDLYPGDDVVDWVSWDIYAYSEPGHGFGDFAEMMNRRASNEPAWPGFYNWAARTFPDKPLMVAEWGVWYSAKNPRHHADFFDSARLQLELFPRVKAYVYFETPNAEGRDSRVQNTTAGLRSFQQFSNHPAFAVKLPRAQVNGREVSPWRALPTPMPSSLP
ncbi:CBM96 family carbohydrate-binding protein [Rhizocola hellebori]|uniref:CBM96 family carbohydrate-binding protein n=1 Tax=Rhizocola hellebori TaxID=1392758 RepID=UPI00194211F0|nr:hypothetical protein [Rhizocola hellebori]